LWTILGYDEVASDVARALSASADLNVVEGPPGVGKSWLVKGIGAMWQSGGGSTVVAEGDVLRSDVDLYPLGLAMAALASGWRSVLPAMTVAAKGSETLTGTSGVITSTIQALGGVRRSRRRARAMFLGDAEQAVLYELERLSRRRPLLIIADNLHWWDSRSLEFLRRLRDPSMCDAFPFLAEMRILAAQTPEPHQSVANPAAHQALLSPRSTRCFELARIPRQGFERVLAAMGAVPEPSASVGDRVYSFSGGHLALVSRCTDRMAQGEIDVLLSASDPDDFLRRLLTERLQSLGPMGAQVMAVLQIAAVLGLTFRREEVACASSVEEAETSRVLRFCREEAVVELDEGLGRFVHDLYRSHFLSLGARDRVEIHERLSGCLRVLRPAEYEQRCMNALEAECPREAGALAVQAGLQRERDGRPWRELPPRVVAALGNGSSIAVLKKFLTARRHLDQYRFNECLNCLDGLPRDLPKCLLAEADYVRAMCLMSTRSEEDRGAGRAILQSWAGYEKEEPDLGVRIMQLLLYGLAKLVDKEASRVLEGQLRQVLCDRVSFDLAAKDALYTLDRCAASLYQPDVSIIRKGEAVAYFGPSEGQVLIRRPVEYYRCLVNFCAGLISNARYEEAREVRGTIERLVEEYSPGTFPRPDFPLMNGLLADYRAGAADAPEAVRRQREIVASLKATNDPFYAKNALAVYLTLADEHSSALDIFNGLDDELMRSRSLPEANMVFLIRGNRCATRFLSGDVLTARTEWTALAEIVNQNTYSFRQLLIRRHALLAEVLGADDIHGMTPRAFDECLIGEGVSEFGPLWDNFGRGFRMPELEFWREN
jgi:hypothetical protein